MVIIGCLTMATEEEGIADGMVVHATQGTQVIDAIEEPTGDITNGIW